VAREHFGQPFRDEYERDFTLILHELSYARNSYFIFKRLEDFPRERMWPYTGPVFRLPSALSRNDPPPLSRIEPRLDQPLWCGCGA
jgi:hypothetical protein